jgi:dihydroorotase
MPTMVDLCARVREPGQQQHGTLKSEGKAARENGILHVITPPDSKPIVQDNGALIHGLIEKAWTDGQFHLHIIGAQTQGLMVNNLPIWRHLKRVAVPRVKCQCIF